MCLQIEKTNTMNEKKPTAILTAVTKMNLMDIKNYYNTIQGK